jgi:heptosyltransferase-2
LARVEERQAAQARLAAAGVGGGPYLVVAPGARFGAAKRYPAERFAAAAESVAAARRIAVVLVGAAEDAAATRAVRDALPSAVDLAGRTTLGELVGILAGATGVLANDSGTMHLAAALGVPTVGVFGSTNPRWTAPRGARATALARPVWCAPCYAPTCVQDFGCMLGIAPEVVARALAAELATPPEPSHEAAR